MAAELVDRHHRKVGEGDENTRRLVRFLKRGFSDQEKQEALIEPVEEGLTDEQRKGELLARFLRGEYGQNDILDLPQTRQKQGCDEAEVEDKEVGEN